MEENNYRWFHNPYRYVYILILIWYNQKKKCQYNKTKNEWPAYYIFKS